MARAPGFTTLELALVIAMIGVFAYIVSLPLGNLQRRTALREGSVAVRDDLRRAQTQAMGGNYGDRWGIHFSDSDGCALPAKQVWIYRGTSFSSSTGTSDVLSLPAAATITAVSVGGGCDVSFSRFDGTTTSTGSVTISDADGATTTVSFNAYGRVSNP